MAAGTTYSARGFSLKKHNTNNPSDYVKMFSKKEKGKITNVYDINIDI